MKNYLNIVAVVIIGACFVPSMYGMDLEPVTWVSLQDNGEDGVLLDLVVGDPEQESTAVQLAGEEQVDFRLGGLSGKTQEVKPEELEFGGRPLIQVPYKNGPWFEKSLEDRFHQNYEGNALLRREFYRTKFRDKRPEGLEREGALHVQQAPQSGEQEAEDGEEKAGAEQVVANQEQEYPMLEMAGPRWIVRQMARFGLRGTVIKDANGKPTFVPFPESVKIPLRAFSDKDERGIAHVIGEERFPVAPIMHRKGMEPFYAAPLIAQEWHDYAPRNGTPAEMTNYLLSSQIISKQ